MQEDAIGRLRIGFVLGGVQAYASLPAGNWTFEVRATDAAGNTEAGAWPARSWAVNITAYVNLVGGDVGATVTRYRSPSHDKGAPPYYAAALPVGCSENWEIVWT